MAGNFVTKNNERGKRKTANQRLCKINKRIDSQCQKHGLDPDQSAQSMTVESLKINKLEKFYNILYTIYYIVYICIEE